MKSNHDVDRWEVRTWIQWSCVHLLPIFSLLTLTSRNLFEGCKWCQDESPISHHTRILGPFALGFVWPNVTVVPIIPNCLASANCTTFYLRRQMELIVLQWAWMMSVLVGSLGLCGSWGVRVGLKVVVSMWGCGKTAEGKFCNWWKFQEYVQNAQRGK